MREYDALANLLESNFHQDWDLECEDEDAVVRQYARTNLQTEIDRAREQTLAFIAAHGLDTCKAFDRHFPSTIVIGSTDEEGRDWLLWLAQRLEEYRDLAPTRPDGRP
ncbi:MAG: contact-dependent growth inhibition system immunity protein [Erythrobacter sp.]|nr:contact-dependent growth inhibition system immunity protein [Erythrobacter sp.]